MKSEKQINLIAKALECARTGPQAIASANTDIVEDGRIIAVKICSRVLDACIWFSFDPDFKPDDEPLTVFYADEIPFLSAKTTDQLKEIHQWKLRVGPGARVRQ
jgi:hypothetical protein